MFISPMLSCNVAGVFTGKGTNNGAPDVSSLGEPGLEVHFQWLRTTHTDGLRTMCTRCAEYLQGHSANVPPLYGSVYWRWCGTGGCAVSWGIHLCSICHKVYPGGVFSALALNLGVRHGR